MAETTHIEWADSTLNIWFGCQETGSPACEPCYARHFVETRMGWTTWGPHGKRVEAKTWRAKLRAISRKALKERPGGPWFVFVNSLSDFWDNQADPELRAEALAEFAKHPHLTFLLLTKRPQMIVKLFRQMLTDEQEMAAQVGEVGFAYLWPRNVAIGCTVVTQAEADRDVPHLLRAKAALNPAFAFLSMEPLVEVVDIYRWLGGAHDAQERRGTGLSAGVVGGALDRRGREGLAARGASMGSLVPSDEVDPLRTAARGEGLGGIPSGSGDGRPAPGERPGTPAGLEALQRTDPAGADGQPQGRQEEAQSPAQPGAGDLFGAAASFDPRPGERPLAEPRIGWVITGGGTDQGKHKAYPTPIAAFRKVRDDCAAAGVPFLLKQWGEWTPGENVRRKRGRVPVAWWFNDQWQYGEENLADTDGHIDDEPDLYRVGKKAAGRMLDGRVHDERPTVQYLEAA
ncbi:DUF5131 family protein [Phenylobacterium sp.]|uniref:DUF5131 family protein n=1 Tax=Phenylobacterium sp. TaxID=1871053 RepID=UPI00392556BF